MHDAIIIIIIAFSIMFALLITEKLVPYYECDKKILEMEKVCKINHDFEQKNKIRDNENKINLNNKRRKIDRIKNYIIANYKHVPKEVANVIAIEIYNLSIKNRINHNLIVGMIGVESSFNPYAESKAKARGLMQVRYSVWKKYLKIKNTKELHNIHEGIEYGILAFLKCRKEAKGDLEKGLQRYSGTKNQNYIDKVYKEIGKFTLFK